MDDLDLELAGMQGSQLSVPQLGQHNGNTNYNEPTHNKFLTMYTRRFPNRVKGAREAAIMDENYKIEINK